jgi:hypothetical protein
MSQSCRDPDFPQEPVYAVARRDLRLEDLDDHATSMFTLVGHKDRCHAAFAEEPLDLVAVGQRFGDRFLEHGPRIRHEVALQDPLSELVGLEHGVDFGAKRDVVSARLIQPPGPRLLGQLEGLVEEFAEPVPAWIGIH